MNDNATNMRREKFRRFFAQPNDYRIFVGTPLARPNRWSRVLALKTDALADSNLQDYPLKDIRSWVVAYTGTGEIVDAENLFVPLPEGVNNIKSQKLPVPIFTDADLRFGRSLVRIQFGKSRTHSENPAYYSTSLTNISNYKLRCHSFGNYRTANGGFVPSTVTGTLFSASQFEAWYGVRRGGWIEPGETVCDPSNYGRGGVWVYHCETDQGTKFHTGERFPSISILEKLQKLIGR